MLILSALAMPCILWFAAYVRLARHHKRWWLGESPVHEGGRRTLLQTILYWPHFLREVPIDLFYALSLYWSTLAIDLAPAISGRTAIAAGAGAVLLVLVGVTVTSREEGWKATALELSQAVEVDGQVGHGTHWQMHFLSTLTLILLFLLPGLLWGTGGFWGARGLLAGFLLTSLVFATGLRALRDSRWLLHGVREIATYLPLVGLPVAVLVAPRWSGPPLRWGAHGLGALALLTLLMLYQGWVVMTRNPRALSRALPQLDLGYLYFSHLFEHVLDVVFIALVLVALWRI